MGKSNGNRGKTIEFRKGQYVDINVEESLITKIENIASYSLQNVSKPIKAGVLYQNGIGLLPTTQVQTLGIKYLRENQIPFIIGGKDKLKGMLGILTPKDLMFDETYLRLVSLYEGNDMLVSQLKKEKEILKYQILSQLGFDYEVTDPLVDLDLIGRTADIFLSEGMNLEGRIISTLNPLIGYKFKIREKNIELKELILEDLQSKLKELELEKIELSKAA